MPVLPLILVLAAASLAGGCERIREFFYPEEKILPETDCSSGPAPDEYRSAGEDPYSVFRLLWGESLASEPGPAWLSRFMDGQEPVVTEARENLGASRVIFSQLCGHVHALKGEERVLAEYHAASTSFFRDYFENRFDPNDSGILVLMAGLAPTSAGDAVVLGAMNALNIPTENKSLAREQRMQFSQVIKAGVYFNLAADRLGNEGRFRIERERVKPGHAARDYAKQSLRIAKDLLDDVDTAKLSAKQADICTTLRKAATNLKASL